jgi:hypothetical protein
MHEEYEDSHTKKAGMKVLEIIVLMLGVELGCGTGS